MRGFRAHRPCGQRFRGSMPVVEYGDLAVYRAEQRVAQVSAESCTRQRGLAQEVKRMLMLFWAAAAQGGLARGGTAMRAGDLGGHREVFDALRGGCAQIYVALGTEEG